MSLSGIKRISAPVPVTDGAGVSIDRVFGHADTGLSDPFLMLDHLHNDVPSVSPGFPWYPHQEMPVDIGDSLLHGFQLWANLPAADKMTDPRYQDIPSAEIPEVAEDDGTSARIITGRFCGKTGPVTGIATDPRYIDMWIPPRLSRTFKIEMDRNSFAYVFEGNGTFFAASSPVPAPTEYVTLKGISEAVYANPVENRMLVLYDSGDELKVQAGEKGLRFLLVSGRPLKEPAAWHSPVVMNTEEELRSAFREYREGTFLRKR